VKGKLASGVGSQYSHTTSERGVSSIIDELSKTIIVVLAKHRTAP